MNDAVNVVIGKPEKQPCWGSRLYKVVIGTTSEFDNELEPLLPIDDKIEFIAQKVKEKMIIQLKKEL